MYPINIVFNFNYNPSVSHHYTDAKPLGPSEPDSNDNNDNNDNNTLMNLDYEIQQHARCTAEDERLVKVTNLLDSLTVMSVYSRDDPSATRTRLSVLAPDSEVQKWHEVVKHQMWE